MPSARSSDSAPVGIASTLDLGALVAHPHDGALAELALDLRQRALQGGVAGLRGLLGRGILWGAHRAAPLKSRLRDCAHLGAGSDRTPACQWAGDGTRRECEDFATKGARIGTNGPD